MRNVMEFDGGYKAVITYDPAIEMFRGEFVGLNGGADFYAKDTEGLKREALSRLDEQLVAVYRWFADTIENVSSNPIYAEAVAFVREQGKASISLIHRRFGLGFNRAARFVKQMEQDGIIGPVDSSKPREVLK